MCWSRVGVTAIVLFGCRQPTDESPRTDRAPSAAVITDSGRVGGTADAASTVKLPARGFDATKVLGNTRRGVGDVLGAGEVLPANGGTRFHLGTDDAVITAVVEFERDRAGRITLTIPTYVDSAENFKAVFVFAGLQDALGPTGSVEGIDWRVPGPHDFAFNLSELAGREGERFIALNNIDVRDEAERLGINDLTPVGEMGTIIEVDHPRCSESVLGKFKGRAGALIAFDAQALGFIALQCKAGQARIDVEPAP